MARRLSEEEQALRRLFVSDDRAQHNAVVVEPREATPGGFIVRSGARVQPVVERLQRRGQLTRRQHAAAAELYRCWALGVCGAKDRQAVNGSWEPAGYADAQLAALARYREARDLLGGRLWPIVFSVAIDDVPVTRWAESHRENTQAQMGVLRVGLDMLADLFGLHGGD